MRKPEMPEADVVLTLDPIMPDFEDDMVNQVQDPSERKSVEGSSDNQISNIEQEESKDQIDDHSRLNQLLRDLKNVSQHSADGRKPATLREQWAIPIKLVGDPKQARDKRTDDMEECEMEEVVDSPIKIQKSLFAEQ